MKDLRNVRNDYQSEGLIRENLALNPIDQFNKWLDEAIASDNPEATAFTLSTVSSEGKPSSRVLLLKEVNEKSLVFFTNYASRKGHDIEVNNTVCALFFWPELSRQVRVEGTVHKIDEAVSDDYFYSRPIGSQYGAMVSQQSEEIKDRESLEAAINKLREEGSKPIRPANWGGYALRPAYFEFWQGRPDRVHDRFVYEADPGSVWRIKRIAP